MKPDLRDTYANSVRREPWRAELLYAELAEKSAERRHAANMRWAFVAGIAIGLIGSYLLNF